MRRLLVLTIALSAAFPAAATSRAVITPGAPVKESAKVSEELAAQAEFTLVTVAHTKARVGPMRVDASI